MARIDPFHPTKVNLTIQEPQNIPLSVNNVALMTKDIATLPVATLVKRYSDASSVGSEFGLTSQEYLFASQFFAYNQGLSYLIMVSFDDTTPTAGYLAEAVEAGFNKSISNGWGGFNGIAWAETSFMSDLSSTISELDSLSSFALDNDISFLTIALTKNADILNQADDNMLEQISEKQYKEGLQVGLHGDPSFSSDPSDPNKRSDGSVFGILSSASKTTLGNLALYLRVFDGLVPVPVGESDSNSILFDKEKVTDLINSDLNLYFQYGQTLIFGLGSACNIAYFIEYKTVYIKLFLEQYAQEQVNGYFKPAELKYDDSGVTAVSSVLSVVGKQMVSDDIIDSFSVTPPVLDYTTADPRILGPFIFNAKIGTTVYGVNITGSISA